MLSLRNVVRLARTICNNITHPIQSSSFMVPSLREKCFNVNINNYQNLSSVSPIVLEPTIVNKGFLTPVSVSLTQVSGLKLKRVLKRRCKDCYMVVRDGRAFIMCPTHGRHKQMSLVKHKKKTWILTHATQGKIRPW